jgi:hypothetical protein
LAEFQLHLHRKEDNLMATSSVLYPMAGKLHSACGAGGFPIFVYLGKYVGF